MTTARAVTDGKMTNEELGLFTRRVDEIKRRINEGTIPYDWAMPELQRVVEGPKPLIIKRTKIFNPAEFVGAGTTIWRGPVDGDGLEGKPDQDERSIALNEVDLIRVRFETTLEKGEKVVNGEERLVRLKSKPLIRLDPGWLVEFLVDTSKIPEHWKKLGYITFDGQVLRYPNGRRYVLCLYWYGMVWYRYTYWLGNDFYADIPSAVLAG